MQRSRSYVQEFDALRGIAIMMVVLHHIELYTRWRVGPDIFFLLSGYLTTRSLGRHDGTPLRESLRIFYRRRLVRLMPPLLAMLVVMTPVMACMPRVEGNLPGNLLAALTETINWQQALTPWESRSLAHLWSLAAEQQFYLLWPPLFLLCPARWRKPLLAVLVCVCIGWRAWLCAHGASFNRIFFGLDTHGDALLAGCLLALTTVPRRFEPILAHAGFGALLALVVAGMVMWATTPWGLAMSTTATTVLAALVVVSVPIAGGPLNVLLSWTPFRLIGRMSYSLYLWNFPIIAYVHPHWHHGEKAAQLVVIAVVSCAAYLWIEKPLIQRLQGGRLRGAPARRIVAAAREEPLAWHPAPRPS